MNKRQISWRHILINCFNYAPKNYEVEIDKNGEVVNSELLRVFNTTPTILKENLDFLKNQGLIEYTSFNKKKKILLKKEGFSVCLDILKHRENKSLQKAIFSITALIAITAIFSFIKEFQYIENDTLFIFYLFSIVALFWVIKNKE